VLQQASSQAEATYWSLIPVLDHGMHEFKGVHGGYLLKRSYIHSFVSVKINHVLLHLNFVRAPQNSTGAAQFCLPGIEPRIFVVTVGQRFDNSRSVFVRGIMCYLQGSWLGTCHCMRSSDFNVVYRWKDSLTS
jgi:hypothetical protein